MRKNKIVMLIVAIVAIVIVVAIALATWYLTGSLSWTFTTGGIITGAIAVFVTINVYNGTLNRIR